MNCGPARLWLLCLTLATCASAAHADGKATNKPDVDAELLEFLGSIGTDGTGEGHDWWDFLRRTDVEKVAATRQTVVATEVKSK